MQDKPPAPGDGLPSTPNAQTTRTGVLAERLKLARAAAKLSQEETAHRVGTTIRSLTRWESGECEPGFTLLCALADTYHVSLDWLADRSNLRTSVTEGCVLVDEDVLDTIRGIADKGGRLGDIPPQMVRHPGIGYAFVVPRRGKVLTLEEAARVDAEVRKCIESMKGRKG